MDPTGFYHAGRALPDEVKRDFKVHLEVLGEEKHEEPLSAENRQALAVLGELGAQHGFDVVVAHAPLYEGLWDEPLFQRSHARLDADLERAASSRPHLRILSGPPVTFPADRMTNVDHLTDEGARAFTEALAARMATRGSASASPKPPASDARSAEQPAR